SALAEVREWSPNADPLLCGGINWLLGAQGRCGGWGGAARIEASTEETALAVEALAKLFASQNLPSGISVAGLQRAVHSGTAWLLSRIQSGQWTQPSPIGFYFAK